MDRRCLPSASQMKIKIPLRFKKSQNIRIIIDCTEFFCAQPRSFHRQGNLYSSYTSHTTFGFISDAFEYSISAREITIQSGLLDKLHRGDLVLADRRFTIKDLLNKKGADLNISLIVSGRSRLTPQEEVKTKINASARINSCWARHIKTLKI